MSMCCGAAAKGHAHDGDQGGRLQNVILSGNSGYGGHCTLLALSIVMVISHK